MNKRFLDIKMSFNKQLLLVFKFTLEISNRRLFSLTLYSKKFRLNLMFLLLIMFYLILNKLKYDTVAHCSFKNHLKFKFIYFQEKTVCFCRLLFFLWNYLKFADLMLIGSNAAKLHSWKTGCVPSNLIFFLTTKHMLL